MTMDVRSWLLATALAAPLLLVGGWLLRSALVPGPPAATLQAPAVSVAPALGVDWPPALDLPASRLEERVDGGADALRAAGCTRLVLWRSESPAADVEALVFDSAEHARAALSREAGEARTPGPGDEAQVSQGGFYLRRGPVLVRAMPDPGAATGAAMVSLAGRLETQIARLR